jgi:hypothetical protein
MRDDLLRSVVTDVRQRVGADVLVNGVSFGVDWIEAVAFASQI